MIKDSTHELMEQEALVPQDGDNQWLQHLSGAPSPRPALRKRLSKIPEKPVVSRRQQRGVNYGK